MMSVLTRPLRQLTRLGHRARKAVSAVRPYRPMGQGRALLDEQYAEQGWAYLRGISEAPRFGVVAAYCRTVAPGGSLLEIGCGDALLYEHLSSADFSRFVGVDISEVAIERTREHWSARTSFVRGEAETYVPEQRFDVIVFNEVLEYLDDPAAVVARYADHLAPGGHLIVSMFAGIDTARSWKIWRQLDRRFTRAASTRLSTVPEHTWNIRVYRPSGDAT